MAEQTRYDRFRKAYQDLDLFPLLTKDQIAEFRVDYGNKTLAHLKAAVSGSLPNGKLIFSGHRGSGKSTLLAKFCETVHDRYFVVPVSIRDTADMSNVSHVDILFAICLGLMDKAETDKVDIPLAVRNAIYDWFAKKTRTSTESVKAEVGGGFNFLKLIFGKLQTEASIRDEIKEEFKPKISVLAKKIDEIAGFVRQATQQDILVVIDELDKLDLELVNDIYKNNVKALFSPALRIIFTIPISVVRDIELKTNLESETGSPIQQMEIANFYTYNDRHKTDATPIEKSVNLFLDVLKKRIPADLLAPGIDRQIVFKSGGVMRELVRLARACCFQCMLQLDSEPELEDVHINQGILNLALRDLRNEFAASLGENRYAILTKTYHNGAPENTVDPEFLLLLHGLYVLEYKNGELWYDLHPIVADLLRSKGRLD